MGCGQTGGESIRPTEASNTANVDAFQLTDIDGKPFDLRQSSMGRVHVVIFVRSDCPISDCSAPEVRRIVFGVSDEGCRRLLIYVDRANRPRRFTTIFVSMNIRARHCGTRSMRWLW